MAVLQFNQIVVLLRLAALTLRGSKPLAASYWLAYRLVAQALLGGFVSSGGVGHCILLSTGAFSFPVKEFIH